MATVEPGRPNGQMIAIVTFDPAARNWQRDFLVIGARIYSRCFSFLKLFPAPSSTGLEPLRSMASNAFMLN